MAQVRCPHCGDTFTPPAAPADRQIVFGYDLSPRPLASDSGTAGDPSAAHPTHSRVVLCPKCQKPLTMPR